MGTAEAMLARARKSIGLEGRPNYITRDYAGRHGEVYLDAPWCDMGVTYWARGSGNEKAVLPAGDRAYTVWHAQDFQKLDRWFSGTAENLDNARPGDVVFFDWGGANSIGAIDHVGVIERVLGGGRVQTIEANTSDACLRRVRSASVIAGFGRPAYDKPKPTPLAAPPGDPVLKRGSRGGRVRMLQRCLLVAGHVLRRYGADGDFGAETEAAVKAFQTKNGLARDGEYGPKTAAKLRGALAKKEG
jgi:hypothetical protein